MHNVGVQVHHGTRNVDAQLQHLQPGHRICFVRVGSHGMLYGRSIDFLIRIAVTQGSC